VTANSQFITLLVAIIAVFVATLAANLSLALYLSHRIDAVNLRVDAVLKELSNIRERLARIETRLGVKDDAA